MKRHGLIALTAATLGSTAALACSDAPQPMVDEVSNALERNGYSGVPVELLNDRQIAQIHAQITTDNSPSETKRFVREALEG